PPYNLSTDQRGAGFPRLQGSSVDIGAFEATPVASAPEIDVQGNNTSITDDDTTPSLTDFTDFGNTTVTGGTIVRTFTIENTGNADLTLSGTPIVAIAGPNASDFMITSKLASPIAPGSNLTFQVTFHPSAAGLRSANITILNNDADEGVYD